MFRQPARDRTRSQPRGRNPGSKHVNPGQLPKHIAGLASAVVVLIGGLLGGCDRSVPDGGPIAALVKFGEPGLSPGQFSYPRAMDRDTESIWIVDKAARIQRLDPETGRPLLGWRMPEWKLGKPTGLTVWRPAGGTETDELIFVPDTHYHRIMVYRVGNHPTSHELGPPDDGTRWGAPVTLIDRFGSYGTEPGHFTYPTDVGVFPSLDGTRPERLYITEYGGTDRVSVFEQDSNGRWVCSFTFGRFGNGSQADPVHFSRPQSIEVDAANRELIIADACNHRIGRFTPEGRLIAWIGGPDRVGQGPGQFAYPYGLSLLGDGSVLVAEFGNNRVQRINLATGDSLGTYGQAGRETGQLATPWAVSVWGGTAYVLDSGNNRVIGFSKPTGNRRADRRGIQ